MDVPILSYNNRILLGCMPLISKHVLYIEGLYDLFNYAACLSLYLYSCVSLSLSLEFWISTLA